MKHHVCVAIGINQYQYLQPLNYAQKDAEAVYEFLVDVAGFPQDKSLLMTDNSPQVLRMSTYPSQENILDWVDSLCNEQLSSEDVLWFFFSGYGFSTGGQDYLLPIDGNPGQLEATGISMQALLEGLKATATDKILVLLDINRSQGAHAGESVGTQTLELAHQLEIPTILSCQPEQLSRETSALRQGFFTATLLEGLKAGNCSTLDQLTHFLGERLPELTEQHLRPKQKPVFAIYPAYKLQQVILPESRQVANISLSNGMKEINMATVEPYQNGTVPLSEDPLKRPTSSYQTLEDSSPKTDEPVTRSEASTQNLSSNSTPSVQQPLPQSPAHSTEDTMSDSSFLQRLILWSGATALVLLFGVFLTNKPIFLGEKTAKSGIGTSDVVSTSKPSSTTTGTETVTPPKAPPTADQLLNESKLFLKDTSASGFSKAIALAKQIPEGDPQFKQAQANIAQWSQTILDIAEGRAQSQDLQGAIQAVQLIPEANPAIYQQSREKLKVWEEQLTVIKNNQAILSQAQELIKPLQASSYSDAIGKAEQISADQPGYSEAQKLIDQWGNEILKIAQSRAKKKQYRNAIEAAKLVPENTSAHPAAVKAIAEWETKVKKK